MAFIVIQMDTKARVENKKVMNKSFIAVFPSHCINSIAEKLQNQIHGFCHNMIN